MQYRQRMYGLVSYNISPIQQAIQYGHALQEYNNEYFARCDKFAQWRTKDKTFIILNGGTTNMKPNIVTGEPFGTLNQHVLTLKKKEIPFATFHEEDLGDQLTAIVFLVDERVWDKENYPDFRDYITEKIGSVMLNDEIKKHTRNQPTVKPDIKNIFIHDYVVWCKSLGSPKNVFLREFLSQFRLA